MNILIVDDDADLRETLCEIFKAIGANVSVAEDGEEALRQIESKKINLIISDLQMPVMDGEVLLRIMQERNLKIPFVFITGQAHFTERRAASLGAAGLIYKPYSVKQMIEKIKNILNPANNHGSTDLFTQLH